MSIQNTHKKLDKPLYSISIICKNEEVSFRRLHESLKDYINRGGEIVIIDTGSTDKTIDILKELGYSSSPKSLLRYEEVGSKFRVNLQEYLPSIIEKFIHTTESAKFKEDCRTNVFDFGAARRYAGSRCTNDWILSVDCDEVFSALNVDAINQVISSNCFHQIAFTFRYRNVDESIQSITNRDKLYNRIYADWKWVVHEQVKPKNNATKLLKGSEFKLGHLPENIIALDHYQHDAEHRSNYLLSMCIDVMKDPNDQHVFWLGRDMHFRGYHRSAIRILKGYIKDYPKAWSAEICMALVYMGDAYIAVCHTCESETEKNACEMKGLSCYFGATLAENNFREPWLRLGYYFYRKQDFFFATHYIACALRSNITQHTYLNDKACYSAEPHVKLYISQYANSNREDSYKTWKKANELFPDIQQVKDHAILFQ